MKNAARKNDIAPEVLGLFNVIEDAFEKLAAQGFKCAAVLHSDGKIFKVERGSAGPGNGLIRKIHDTTEHMAVNGTPEKTPEYLSACYGEGAASIEGAAENIRASATAIAALADLPDCDTDAVKTLARMILVEAEGVAHELEAMDENFA